MEKIGLIAGSRKFPILFSQMAKKKNYKVIAIAVKDDTSCQLAKYVDRIYWLGLKDFSRIFEILNREGINKIVMAGQINPRRLFNDEVGQDPILKGLFSELKDRKAETIFKAICDKFEEQGVKVMDSITFLDDFLPKRGVLTKRAPSFSEWEDIYFGFELAKRCASLDIGQAVAVKDKAVVAVEALEGTDALIKRAGKITKGGAVVVKVSRPAQDLRFDIPVVGEKTVSTLIKTKACCLAIESGKTLFIEQEKSLKAADNNNLAIVAL